MALRTLLWGNQVRVRSEWVGLSHHGEYAWVAGHDLTQCTERFGAHENRWCVQSHEHDVQDGEEQALEALHTSHLFREMLYPCCLLLGAARRFSGWVLYSTRAHTLGQKRLPKTQSKRRRVQIEPLM